MKAGYLVLRKLFFILIILSLLPVLCIFAEVSFIDVSPAFAQEGAQEKFVVGGSCQYKKYKGRAEIISITKKGVPDSYEVKFSFHSDQEIKETFAQTKGREFPLMLSNFSHPGPKFLEKYGIEVGRVFDCYLNVITKGTCTPIIFEFPSINLDDYIEN